MAITLRIPPALRSITNGADEFPLDAPDVAAAIDAAESAFPGLKERICSADGSVLRFVNLFVNEDDIRMLDGLQTALKEGDSLSIIPAIAGGAPRR